MANATRIKVELKDLHIKNDRDKDAAFRALHAAFKRQVSDAGIIALWKQHQYAETDGQKRRRKRKEAALNRRKEANKTRIMGRAK